MFLAGRYIWPIFKKNPCFKSLEMNRIGKTKEKGKTFQWFLEKLICH